jgi:hypothetical protein
VPPPTANPPVPAARREPAATENVPNRGIDEAIARGDLAQALSLIEAAPASNDPAVQSALDRVLVAARRDAAQAFDEARQSNPRRTDADYRQGIAKRSEADRLAARRRKTEAARAFISAARLFARVAADRPASASVREEPPQARTPPAIAQAPSATPPGVVSAPPATVISESPVIATGLPPESPVRTSPAPPASRPSVVDTRAADEQAIHSVLNQYQAAYSALDAGAVSQLVSSLSVAQLRQQFGQLKSYNVTVADRRIEIQGDRATVTSTREIAAITKLANQQERRSIPTTFLLRRSSSSWVIESVK